MEVPTIAAAAACFFVCHCLALQLSTSGYSVNLQLGIVLPVTHVLAVMLAAAHLENLYLFAAAVGLDGGHHLAARQEGGANLHIVALAYHQHLVQLDGAAFLGRKTLNPQGLA